MVKNLLKSLIRTNSTLTKTLLEIYKRINTNRRNLQFMSFGLINDYIPDYSGLLKKGYQGFSYGPLDVGEFHQKIVSINHPDLHYRLFSMVKVSSLSSSVVVNNSLVLVEGVPGHQTDYDYSSGHLIMHGEESAIVKQKPISHIKKGIFIAGNGANNYYHWLIEIAAKCQLLADIPIQYRKWPLLVSEKVREISVFKSILDKLISEYEVIYMAAGLTYMVNSLIWIDTPNRLPFNMSYNAYTSTKDFYLREDSIVYLRAKLLSENKSHKQLSFHERIFLSRKSDNRNYNKEAVIELFEDYGFKLLYMEDYELEEQINIVKHAKYIAGPTGAAWTNILFCTEGTQCICWMAKEYGEFSAFSNIAKIVGVDLHYLRGACGETEISKITKSTYKVDMDAIKGLFKKLKINKVL